MVLGLDELEAVRLADLEGLYHEEAGKQMGVSRATFGRIVQNARKKIALALVEGKALHIEGGPIDVMSARSRCQRCSRKLRQGDCPFCKKYNPKASHD